VRGRVREEQRSVLRKNQAQKEKMSILLEDGLTHLLIVSTSAHSIHVDSSVPGSILQSGALHDLTR
jgi:hypothetical protein